MSRKTFMAASLAVFCGTGALRSDEGMWLYNDPPREQVRAKYGFEMTDAWLEHLQKSSVRFNSGGSGSFVSEIEEEGRFDSTGNDAIRNAVQGCAGGSGH